MKLIGSVFVVLIVFLSCFNSNGVFSQEAPNAETESGVKSEAASSLPDVSSKGVANARVGVGASLTSVTLALLGTLALFVVLVFLVKFSSPLRFRSSSGAFKTLESSFIMRGKVELATIAWRDKTILIARAGDSIIKLSEIKSEDKESPREVS